VERVADRIADPALRRLFTGAFPLTLDTTIRARTIDGRPDTFVITGDIDAMWLRDSAAQLWPYVPLAADDPGLATMLQGVLARQARCILLDPYANAFTDGDEPTRWADDLTEMRPGLHERKWELDSLAYPMRLGAALHEATGDPAPYDATWWAAMRLAVATMRVQQRRDGPGPYTFRRRGTEPLDTLPLRGRGLPVRPVGLIACGFRPSDDACTLPFHVPANHLAVVALRALARLAGATGGPADLARDASALAAEVEEALTEHALVTPPDEQGPVWAYEVDGFGGAILMDDANIPSLLSLPYLGAVEAHDPVYRRTRRRLLGDRNPFFARGAAGEGIGSPHTLQGTAWPLSIVMRALTSADDAEIETCLATLVRVHADHGLLFESFAVDDASRTTRPWFAWACSLFGELIVRLDAERPHLLAVRSIR
jgi:meiotically up-regulated gene 157 (Mug157) protein